MAGVFVPIPGCPFGRMVTDKDGLSPEEYVEALHEHGMLLFRGNTDIEPEELVDWLRSRFPEAVRPLARLHQLTPPHPIPATHPAMAPRAAGAAAAGVGGHGGGAREGRAGLPRQAPGLLHGLHQGRERRLRYRLRPGV